MTNPTPQVKFVPVSTWLKYNPFSITIDEQYYDKAEDIVAELAWRNDNALTLAVYDKIMFEGRRFERKREEEEIIHLHQCLIQLRRLDIPENLREFESEQPRFVSRLADIYKTADPRIKYIAQITLKWFSRRGQKFVKTHLNLNQENSISYHSCRHLHRISQNFDVVQAIKLINLSTMTRLSRQKNTRRGRTAKSFTPGDVKMAAGLLKAYNNERPPPGLRLSQLARAGVVFGSDGLLVPSTEKCKIEAYNDETTLLICHLLDSDGLQG
ncbi:hypothetical protein GLAREA_09536 [Glarea lozoyensis ATCC 20868]|uniref:Uncharacterized protein n=1 Tax=Glarea lozoyensis (strain ATCC 20868 / MF5171) TaxID=1116229 RepID=S3D8U3_GLAL2|nr:uncharacterized protein GLAREA_09536 [Glarea lozoyensis ATCC 20868]EPE28416.1 hypothetical protein GLAREA_09536 [Glarea lozoyensis ATCC 20868]